MIKNRLLQLAFVALGTLASTFSSRAQLLALAKPDASPAPSIAYTIKNTPAQFSAVTRDAHLTLLYYSDSELAARVQDMKNAKGQPLVIDQGRQILAWNEDRQNYDTLQSGLRRYNRKSGFKGVVTYDPRQNIIAFHNAGTNFANGKEVVYAMATMVGKRPPAVKDAVPFFNEAMEDLQSRFPEINKTTTIDFYGHSIGAGSVVVQMAQAHKQGYIVSATLVDPFYAAQTMHKVKRHADAQERKSLQEFYENATMTMDPKEINFIRYLPPFNIGKNIGQTLYVTKNPAARNNHDIHNYIGRHQTENTTGTYVSVQPGYKL